SLALVEGDRLVNVAATGIEEHWTGCEGPLAEGPIGECIATGRTLRVDDALSHPGLDAILSREGAAFRSWVAVPLVHDSRNLGILTVAAPVPAAFQDGDVNTLQILAGTLAAALSLAERFEENQSLVLERTEALRALGASEERFRALIENAR